MKKLKGKCKTCCGCGLQEDYGFKGRKKCKYYIRAEKNRNWFLIVAVLVEFIGIFLLFYGFYKFMMLGIGG